MRNVALASKNKVLFKNCISFQLMFILFRVMKMSVAVLDAIFIFSVLILILKF